MALREAPIAESTKGGLAQPATLARHLIWQKCLQHIRKSRSLRRPCKAIAYLEVKTPRILVLLVSAVADLGSNWKLLIRSFRLECRTSMDEAGSETHNGRGDRRDRNVHARPVGLVLGCWSKYLVWAVRLARSDCLEWTEKTKGVKRDRAGLPSGGGSKLSTIVYSLDLPNHYIASESELLFRGRKTSNWTGLRSESFYVYLRTINGAG